MATRAQLFVAGVSVDAVVTYLHTYMQVYLHALLLRCWFMVVLQGQMGLHGRLVDADTFLPLQGVVTVATPNHHRPTYIADNDGEFFMLLAPDVLYCITIHASDPLHPSHKYYAIHVAVLRMGRNKIISGSGPRSLTERSMFFAERVYVDAAPFSHGSSGPAAARRLQGNWRSQRQVLLGQAAAGMCSPLEEKSTVPGLAGAREVWG